MPSQVRADAGEQTTGRSRRGRPARGSRRTRAPGRTRLDRPVRRPVPPRTVGRVLLAGRVARAASSVARAAVAIRAFQSAYSSAERQRVAVVVDVARPSHRAGSGTAACSGYGRIVCGVLVLVVVEVARRLVLVAVLDAVAVGVRLAADRAAEPLLERRRRAGRCRRRASTALTWPSPSQSPFGARRPAARRVARRAAASRGADDRRRSATATREAACRTASASTRTLEPRRHAACRSRPSRTFSSRFGSLTLSIFFVLLSARDEHDLRALALEGDGVLADAGPEVAASERQRLADEHVLRRDLLDDGRLGGLGSGRARDGGHQKCAQRGHLAGATQHGAGAGSVVPSPPISAGARASLSATGRLSGPWWCR